MASILPFIEDEKIISLIGKFLKDFEKIQEEAEKKMDSNALDPFSAILFSLANNSNLETWLTGELSRQINKSFQNNVGELHQDILGSCHGWEIIDNIFDIKCDSKEIIAEIKNKHNTTKGEDRIGIYDKLVLSLEKSEYYDYTAYFVEIIPKNQKIYNKPFTPSDNKTKKRRLERQDIRVIDGKSFYDLVTGYKDSLRLLYDTIPYFVEKVKGKGTKLGQDACFSDLFTRTYR